MKRKNIIFKSVAGVLVAGVMMTGVAFADEAPLDFSYTDYTDYLNVDIDALNATNNGWLVLGSTGSEVKRIQEILKLIQLFDGEVDGVFGPQTQQAVITFQSMVGLSPDGIVGSETKRLLEVAEREERASTPAIQETATPAPAADTAATTTTATSYGSVALGSTGDQVAAVQRALMQWGYDCSSADGIFGQKTDAAVRAFQKANGITPDGIAGPLTQAALFSSNAVRNGTTTTTTQSSDSSTWLKVGSTGEAVRKMQQGLINTGYPISSADGIFGRQTEAAVKMFQQDNGITPDGIAGQITLDKLYQSNPFHEEGYTPIDSATDSRLLVGSKGEAVAQLQRRLIELGYEVSAVDGDFGGSTALAVKNFQQINGLDADGIAGPLTIAALNSSSAKPYDASKIEASLTEVQKLARKKLDEIGWDLRAAYNWCARIPYVDDTAWTVADGATYAFKYNKGDCVCKAAAFVVLARELGFQSNFIWGSVLLGNGNQGAHAWTETWVNGQMYVIDPEFETQENRNGYMISYGQRGTWKYTKQKEWPY